MSDYNAARAWVAEQRRLEDSSQAYIRRDPFDGGTDEDARRNAEYWAWDANLQAEKLKIAAAERERKKAELAAYHAERQAERDAAWAAGAGERAERKKQEERELAERELAEREAELHRRNVEDALRAQADAEIAAREKQDNDFHAFSVRITIKIENPGQNDDDDEKTFLGLDDEITEALAPWIKHYQGLGLFEGDDDSAQSFHLVCRADDEPLAPAGLLTFSDARLHLKAMPGATLVVSSSVKPINATMLYDTAHDCPAGLSQSCGEPTPELKQVESRADWLARLTMQTERLARTVERWEISGRDPTTFAVYGNASERVSGDSEISWFADGRIPRGAITLLAGSSAAGKSSLAHEWIAAAGGKEVTRPRTILGAQLAGRFVAALIAGEDDHGFINYRAARHAKLWGEADYLVLTDVTKGLDLHLERLSRMPVIDLVVIDTVRAFFVGDEKSTADVDAFCSKLVAFARAKNCAVVLVHHITKGSVKDLGECKSLAELKVRIRGATAFVDIARMVIGVVKRRDGTVEIGPVKYNFPAETVWAAMGQGHRYWPNPDTFTLDPLAPASSAAEAELSPNGSTTERVLAAIERCNRTGSIVRKSGKTGLFECKLPELGGLSRAAVLDAIGALVGRAEIIDGEAGLLVSPASQ